MTSGISSMWASFAVSVATGIIRTATALLVKNSVRTTVTTNVPSFVNFARSFDQMTDMNPEVFAATQRRAFERRGIQQQDWHVELIQEMYRRAAEGRQLADEPLSL